MDAYQLPEIMRTPLEELCLQIKVESVQGRKGREGWGGGGLTDRGHKWRSRVEMRTSLL